MRLERCRGPKLIITREGATAGRGSRARDIYDHGTMHCFLALAPRGFANTEAVEGYDHLPTFGVRTWLRMKPRGCSDLGKLLVAALLIVSRQN